MSPGLFDHRSIGEHPGRMIYPPKAAGGAQHMLHQLHNRWPVAHVAAYRRHAGPAAGNPSPVGLAAVLHPPTARDKHELPMATTDEHTHGQKTEAS
eukprot:scaffold43405_cov270-Isochrysis_galbana.AAC.1